MDRQHYYEMVRELDILIRQGTLINRRIVLFGHCDATEKLIDLLLDKGYLVESILDNNARKWSGAYRSIPIQSPDSLLQVQDSIVLIAARAFEAMVQQLRGIGYSGEIFRLVHYNSYACYSLSKSVRELMVRREQRGQEFLDELNAQFGKRLKVLCPFSALGDVYLAMSFLPYYLEKLGYSECVVCVVGRACSEVARMFGQEYVLALSQDEMDELVQAALYTRDTHVFIAHQDRPYVTNLHLALHKKMISLQTIYCCGVFGLPYGTPPVEPKRFQDYSRLNSIEAGHAVILSPYAKSVTELPNSIWGEIIRHYRSKGYQCYTNVAKNELPLPGTEPISPSIMELKSLVEHAGTFVGIRSGLCDVLNTAKAQKIALYPDYFYSDTQWKAIDIYYLDNWTNIAVEEGKF